jgi:hypothetical protein
MADKDYFSLQCKITAPASLNAQGVQLNPRSTGYKTLLHQNRENYYPAAPDIIINLLNLSVIFISTLIRTG